MIPAYTGPKPCIHTGTVNHYDCIFDKRSDKSKFDRQHSKSSLDFVI